MDISDTSLTISLQEEEFVSVFEQLQHRKVLLYPCASYIMVPVYKRFFKFISHLAFFCSIMTILNNGVISCDCIDLIKQLLTLNNSDTQRSSKMKQDDASACKHVILHG